MDIIESLKLKIQSSLAKLNQEVSLNDIIIEKSKDTSHGDYASNVAMKSARLFGKAPRDVAALIIENLDMNDIDKVEIAGPGFINFRLKPETLWAVLNKIESEKDQDMILYNILSLDLSSCLKKKIVQIYLFHLII